MTPPDVTARVRRANKPAGDWPLPPFDSRAWVIDLGVVLVLALVVSLIWFQGWQARQLRDLDLITFYRGALALLRSGTLPERGQLYSFRSYAPPGTAYLIALGMALFRDPRLFELPATVLLYSGTAVTISLVGRRTLGRFAGVAAGVITAISRLGMQNPIETPFFAVLGLYCLVVWVQDRKPASLAFACVAEACALYVYPKNLPFAIAIPAVWLLFRPPVSARSLLLALGAIVVMWFPYARFETGRGFIDVRSYVLRKPISALEQGGEARRPPCLAELIGEVDTRNGVFLPYLEGSTLAGRIVYPGGGGRQEVKYYVCATLSSVDRNFDGEYFLLGGTQAPNVLLWMIFMTGMMALLFSSLRSMLGRFHVLGVVIPRKGLAVFGLAITWGLASYLLLDPALIGKCCTPNGSLGSSSRLVLEQLRLFFPLMGACTLLGWYLEGSSGGMTRRASVLAPALWVPWVILVLLSEPDRADRFLWFWPFQVVAIVVALVLLARLTRRSALCFGVLAMIVLVMITPADFFSAKVSDWSRYGYAGQDSGQLAIVDYLGSAAARRGVTSLRVGYQLVWPHFTVAESPDPDYREGTWFDFLLELRYRLQNPNHEVQGLSDQDIYRVLELSTGETAPTVPPWPGFRQAAGFGHFVLYERE